MKNWSKSTQINMVIQNQILILSYNCIYIVIPYP
ncbi:unnamed protein product [Acanthoscelides obtectus]|uniref:Uncharacterized protein n=1 Tax=Acanthoscelides obtectus TaxID=200917 RepID=A0A9P0KI11_ACAOB|nr:unnamed protein product [Acanthoscelides obtectus]CAK1651975.1 hypothetical protein AOBTE_LOCUS17585 [Acanthoscelides obtectus]